MFKLICPREYVIGGSGKTVFFFFYDTFASSRCSLYGPSRKKTEFSLIRESDSLAIGFAVVLLKSLLSF